MTPLPGLLDFLELCRAAGLAVILVTNAPRLDAVHTLEVLGLSDRQGGCRFLFVCDIRRCSESWQNEICTINSIIYTC